MPLGAIQDKLKFSTLSFQIYRELQKKPGDYCLIINLITIPIQSKSISVKQICD